MLSLPITFALSLLETGWVLSEMDDDGNCIHTLHCKNNENLLSVLSERILKYRNETEKKYGKYYIPVKPEVMIDGQKLTSYPISIPSVKKPRRVKSKNTEEEVS
jgi:hypothetical protein